MDAEQGLLLQKMAYWSEAEIYNDFTIPTLLQALEEMQADIASQTVLIAIEDDCIKGSSFSRRFVVSP
jgi:hypothetical protein